MKINLVVQVYGYRVIILTILSSWMSRVRMGQAVKAIR